MNVEDFIIRTPELQKILANRPEAFTLLDVREQEEYDEAKIDGCVLIPLGEILSRAKELNPEHDIVIYCAHGVRSMHALMALRHLGFEKLRSLEGGISDYLGIP